MRARLASTYLSRGALTAALCVALAGIDYALGPRTSVGVALRWARFDDVDDEIESNLIRSHAPVLADGVTPWAGDAEFGGIGYQAVTVHLKYRF